MTKILFISHTNYDNLGKRVVVIYQNTENTFFSQEELSDTKINELCGLSQDNVDDIREWLGDEDIENNLQKGKP
jgi:hypothetical protein